jgi:hypothetical protein
LKKLEARGERAGAQAKAELELAMKELENAYRRAADAAARP